MRSAVVFPAKEKSGLRGIGYSGGGGDGKMQRKRESKMQRNDEKEKKRAETTCNLEFNNTNNAWTKGQAFLSHKQMLEMLCEINGSVGSWWLKFTNSRWIIRQGWVGLALTLLWIFLASLRSLKVAHFTTHKH